MPHSTQLPPGVFETTVNYMLEPPAGEKYPTVTVNSVGARRQKHNPQTVQITDIRGQHENFTLDKNGFQFVPDLNLPADALKDDESIKAQAYDAVISMVKKETGASYAFIFSHIARRDFYQTQLDIPKDLPDNATLKLDVPAMFAHVDQSYLGAKRLASGRLPGDDNLSKRTNTRWGIINAWIPIAPVTREPLAVCDAASVPDTDLEEVTYRIRRDDVPGKVGPQRSETFLWYARHNPAHKWYWPSHMQPGEALLIKCFDSKLDGRARRSLHSAVRTPMDDGPARQSVEVRCLVFWEDQPHEGAEEEYHVESEDRWEPDTEEE